MTRHVWSVLVALLLLLVSPAAACTGIRLKAEDGAVIYARTLEFGMDLRSNVIVIPRGKEFSGTAPDNRPGLPWVTKYASAGANAFDLPVLVDGVNEAGLAVGIFYFPGYAKYQGIDATQSINPWPPGNWRRSC